MIDKKGLMTDNKPAMLQIWGADTKDRFSEMLYGTNEITNADWVKHEIRFTPTINCDYIFIKPCYTTESEAYNGNILLDNLSRIELIGE